MAHIYLFCDANGTIFDDLAVWEQAVQKTFLAFGTQPPSLAEFFTALKTGDYLEPYRTKNITASRDDLNAVYAPAYESQLGTISLNPYVYESLLHLHQRGVRLILLTTQQAHLIRPLIHKHRLENLFSAMAFHVLNKSAAIRRYMSLQSLEPNTCYFIGDTPSDIRAGKSAGITTIALRSRIPEHCFSNDPPHHWITAFHELAGLVL